MDFLFCDDNLPPLSSCHFLVSLPDFCLFGFLVLDH